MYLDIEKMNAIVRELINSKLYVRMKGIKCSYSMLSMSEGLAKIIVCRQRNVYRI